MKELVCIVCPRGCVLNVDGSGDPLRVTGNGCKRGRDFALSEMTAPMRTLCTTVRTSFREVPVVPVRVSSDIPKSRIFDVMREINSLTLTRPARRGDVILNNVLGLGVDVIVTSDVLSESIRQERS